MQVIDDIQYQAGALDDIIELEETKIPERDPEFITFEHNLRLHYLINYIKRKFNITYEDIELYKQMK